MNKLTINDEYFLTIAVAEAQQAWQTGNAPVGAVVTNAEGRVLTQNHNQVCTNSGLLYHAEMMIFLQNQALFVQNRWTMTLYTTLEPCLMCLSTAIVHHVKRVVWLIDDYWSGGTRCLNYQSSYLRDSQYELVHRPIPHLKARVMPWLITFYSRKWPDERVAAMLGERCRDVESERI
jgi:tRNA(adenine34) deaminase